MATPKNESHTADNDMPEVKKPMTHAETETALSEWERARECSKTWSMEQD